MEGFGHDYGFTLEPAVPEQSAQNAVWRELEELIVDPGLDATALSGRASARLVELSTDELARALTSQSHQGMRKRLINTALKQVTPDAVHALARAAGVAYAHPVSPVLDALLNELKQESVELPEAVRERADHAFRSLVRHMVETWAATTVDMSATGYEHLFQEAAENTRTAAVAPEPERVVQLALETGAVGNVLWAAVAVLSEDEGIRKLLGMVKIAPPESRAATMIAQQFANPQRLIMLLREDEVDFDAVDALLKYMGGSAAEPLLDELVSANSRAVRRGILDRLIKLGPDICPAVTLRMKDDRWFVLRNMLHVLNEAGCDLRKVDLAAYQNHTDPRVRREALQLLFKDPVARDRALANAFKDKDPHMIRAGMKAAARDGLPDVAVPVLAKRILDADFPPEFRVPSIQLLGRSRSVLALDALLKFVIGGNTLLGKPKLAAKSPEMLAAVKGLARTWPAERRAKVLLELAAASKDAQIIAAAEAVQGTTRMVETDDDAP